MKLKLYHNFETRFEKKKFKISQSAEDLKFLLTNSKNISVWFAGVRTDPRNKNETHFAFEIVPGEIWMGFKYNDSSSSLEIFDIFTRMREDWVQFYVVESVQSDSGAGYETKNFLNSLLESMRNSEQLAHIITTEHVYKAWESLITAEEDILRASVQENFRLEIKKILSAEPDQFWVQVSGPVDVLHSRVNGDFILRNPEIGNILKGFHIKNKKNFDLIQVTHPDPKALLSIIEGCFLAEDISGKKVEVERKRKAFSALESDQTANPELRKLLVNPQMISASQDVQVITEWFDQNLSDEAKVIVQKAFNSSNIFLIQGPPGTGKTTTIAEICNQAAERGQSVLVAGQTNLAIDNALEKVLAKAPERAGSVIRLGSIDKISIDDVKKHHLSMLAKDYITGLIQEATTFSQKSDVDFVMSADDLFKLEQVITLNTRISLNEQDVSSIQPRIDSLNTEIGDLEQELEHTSPYWNLLDELVSEPEHYIFLEALVNLDLTSVKVDDYQSSLLRTNALNSKLASLNEELSIRKKELSEIARIELVLIPDLLERLRANPEKGVLSKFFGNPTEKIQAELDQLKLRVKKVPALKQEVTQLQAEIKSTESLIGNEKSCLSQIPGDILERVLMAPGKYSELEDKMQLIPGAREKLQFMYTKGWKNVHEFHLHCAEMMDKHEVLSNEKNSFQERINAYSVQRTQLLQQLSGFSPLLNRITQHFGPEAESVAHLKSIANSVGGEKTRMMKNRSKELLRDFTSDLKKESARDSELVENFLLNSASICMATCSQTASKFFENMQDSFDWVIIDEASKALPTELIIPLIRGKRLIMVGDHKQLKPMVDHAVKKNLSEEARHWVDVTLFEDLYLKVPEANKEMLSTQYRMHPEIAALVSTIFYEEKLKNGIRDSVPSNVPLDPVSFIQVQGREEAVNTSFINESEVNLILSSLRKIRPQLIKSKQSVGIISMYKSQVDYIQKRLGSEFNDLDIEVNTVDSFQGREKHIIYLSTVRTEALGFLSDPQRINVAISRAMNHLVIIGHEDLLLKNPYFRKVLTGYQQKRAA